MKPITKLLAVGAAAVAGAWLYKRYQDSYEELPEEETDFIVTEQSDDEFDFVEPDDEAAYEE